MRGSFLSAYVVIAGLMEASPAGAQQPWEAAASLSQALARTIETALPRTGYDHTLTWSGFGVRGGHDVFWSLFTPEQAADTASEERQSRGGWISANGASGAVHLCGGRDRVEQMDVLIDDLWARDEEVADLLQLRGVTATLIETRTHRPLADIRADDGRTSDHYRGLLDARPALRRWRLEAPQRLPATLSARHFCTPPGTRYATRCATLWSLHFAVGDAAETAAPCPGAGRYRLF